MSSGGFPYPLACEDYFNASGADIQIRCRNANDTTPGQCPSYARPDPANPDRCVRTDGAMVGMPTQKICPAGYMPDPRGGLDGTCVKVETPSCPSGSTLYTVVGRLVRGDHPMCIPNSVQLVEKTPQGQTWPCDTGSDFAIYDQATGKLRCVPPPSAAPAPAPESSSNSPRSVPAALESLLQSLKPFRPPTAPASDLEIERKAVRKSQPSFIYVQLVLFVLLAVMVTYLVFPSSAANGISFLLLCVGIAAGFFLRK
jgi:hypothetical protein